MKDIIERLRRYSYQQGTDDELGQLLSDLVSDLHEAADEIESLRFKRLCAALQGTAKDKRIAELEGALHLVSGRMKHPRCPRCADNQEVAKQALGGDDE